MHSTADTWISFISDHEPRHLLTITFRDSGKPWSDVRAISTLNRFLYFVNSTLFRKRYQRGEDYLQGFAVLEHQGNDMPHFHIMLTNRFDHDVVQAALHQHIKKFSVQVDTSKPEQRARLRKSHQRGIPRWAIKDAARQYIRPVPIFSEQGIDVREINQTTDDTERLTAYLQKESGEFLLLGRNGLTYPDNQRTPPYYPVISRRSRAIPSNIHDA